MTEHHLNDEELSAHLDGADAGWGHDASDVVVEEHLAGCETCALRLTALREASVLVSTPVAAASVATKERVAAEAVRTGFRSTVPRAPSASRWYRRPRVLVGAAAALVALGLGVALPLAISTQSSTRSNTTATRSSASAPGATHNGSSPESSPGPGGASSSPVQSAGGLGLNGLQALPDLGTVGTAQEVVTRLGLVAVPQVPYAQSETAFGVSVTSLSSCISATRSAAHGGAYGPGLVATATYRGEKALVMEFWPTSSIPPAGHTVVAVSAQAGCKLLARTST